MNVLSFFHRPRSAPVARERLQLLLAHERSASDGDSDLLEVLRDEILQVIELTVVLGIHGCNLAVPILAEELAKGEVPTATTRPRKTRSARGRG